MPGRDLAIVAAELEAEAAGDVETALSLHLGVPSPPLAPQLLDLTELQHLGEAVPSWAIGRWLSRQAVRRLLFDVDPRVREAVIVTAVTMHPAVDLLEMSPQVLFEFGSFMATSSWVVHQLLVHEMGGLEDFLDRRASPELVARAGDVWRWCAAPMGGYRLDGVHGDRLELTDLGDDGPVEVLNIGSLTGSCVGQCVVGRLVAGSDGLMFMERPLPVRVVVARDVARAGARAGGAVGRYSIGGGRLPPWLAVLDRHVQHGLVSSDDDRLLLTPLTSDVVPDYALPDDNQPDNVPVATTTSPRTQELVGEGLDPVVAHHVGVCEVGLTAAAVSGAQGAGAAGPHVALCLVQPGVLEAALEHCTSPEQEQPWRVLAGSFTGLARRHAHQIADACRRPAA